MLRVDGDLKPLCETPDSHDDIHQAMMRIMSLAQQAVFSQHQECDFAFELADGVRFRVNVFEQARGMSVVF